MQTSPSLQAELRRHKEASRGRLKPEVAETMARATDELVRSGIVDGALRVGQRAPDFALPNVRGEEIRLGDLLGRSAVVLAFYRGGW